jgi:type II restriction enzyme
VQVALSQRGLAGYKSNAQRARIATETWAQENLYCPNCESPHLDQSRADMPAVDFDCPDCHAPFQLKAQSRTFSGRIVDAAHSAMVRAIRENRTPNLLALHYEFSTWSVANLILIPSFAFPLSAIEKRKPLSAIARRAGWVGCNILLHAIPRDARISVIVDGVALPRKQVRQQYARIRPLASLKTKQRGWTLDVLNAVRALGKKRFSLDEIYALEGPLSRLHPANRNIQPKIRQQLQILRDLGLLDFLGSGEYRLR